MSKEIVFKKRGYAAVFIMDNQPDCDFCQLYELDGLRRVKHISNWVKLDFFTSNMTAKNELIAKLKAQIAEQDKELLKIKGERK